MSSWTAFWIAVAVYIICECVLTLNGIDTLLWRFKSPVEKQLQQRIVGGYQPDHGPSKPQQPPKHP